MFYIAIMLSGFKLQSLVRNTQYLKMDSTLKILTASDPFCLPILFISLSLTRIVFRYFETGSRYYQEISFFEYGSPHRNTNFLTTHPSIHINILVIYSTYSSKMYFPLLFRRIKIFIVFFFSNVKLIFK